MVKSNNIGMFVRIFLCSFVLFFYASLALAGGLKGPNSPDVDISVKADPPVRVDVDFYNATSATHYDPASSSITKDTYLTSDSVNITRHEVHGQGTYGRYEDSSTTRNNEQLETQEPVTVQNRADDPAETTRLQDQQIREENARQEESTQNQRLEQDRIATEKANQEAADAKQKQQADDLAETKRVEDKRIRDENARQEEWAQNQKLEQDRIATEKANKDAFDAKQKQQADDLAETKRIEDKRIREENKKQDEWAKNQRLEEKRIASEKSTKKRPALPDSAWHKDAPHQITPGTKTITHQKYNPKTKQLETSRVEYDQYGRQVKRTDYTDHGYGDISKPKEYHSDPHTHTYEYGPGYGPKGKETRINQ